MQREIENASRERLKEQREKCRQRIEFRDFLLSSSPIRCRMSCEIMRTLRFTLYYGASYNFTSPTIGWTANTCHARIRPSSSKPFLRINGRDVKSGREESVDVYGPARPNDKAYRETGPRFLVRNFFRARTRTRASEVSPEFDVKRVMQGARVIQLQLATSLTLS